MLRVLLRLPGEGVEVPGPRGLQSLFIPSDPDPNCLQVSLHVPLKELTSKHCKQKQRISKAEAEIITNHRQAPGARRLTGLASLEELPPQSSHPTQRASPEQRGHGKHSRPTLRREKENYPLQFQFRPNRNE